MDHRLATICIAFSFITLYNTNPLSGQTILIDSGSDWKYLDDGSDQGTSWRKPSFNDEDWDTGAAQLGYGDDDETTVISYGSNPNTKYTTYYFRHSFYVTDPSQYSGLSLELLRDDGAVVYLNDFEIERSSMPPEPIDYLTFASSGASGDEEDMFYESFTDPSYLVAGTNVLAVEVHQISATSSDVSFDLRLVSLTEHPDVTHKAPYIIYSGINTEMQVLWQLYYTNSCTIAWGTDTQYSLGSAQTNEYGNDHQHAYTITNLIPNTKYYYRVTVNQQFYTGSFRSGPNLNASSIKFIVYGDSRSHPDDHDQVARDIVDTYVEDENFQTFLLSAGDLVGDGNIESDWDDHVFNPLYSNIQEMLATLPFLTCMGNHDRDGVLFKKYFPYPYVAGRYWSFDYGFVHIAIVDQYTNYEPGSAQLAWIEDDLASRTKSWNIILLHQPGWSSGRHSNDSAVQDYIQPLCEQYNVHIVFGGHNHYYARAVVNSVHHITTGGGGASLYDPLPGYPNIVASAAAYHFCKVEIEATQLTTTVVDTSGNIIDIFSIGDLSLPVELSEFVAHQEDKIIVLEWITESELENLGFILERKESHSIEWKEIASYINCTELQGKGSIPYRTDYRFEDKTTEIGETYDYRLADISYDGDKQYHSMIPQIKSISLRYELFQNHPNPFNPVTEITFTLPIESYIALKIYDLLGKEIAILAKGKWGVGTHRISFNGKNFPSGLYLFQLKAGNITETKRMILMK